MSDIGNLKIAIPALLTTLTQMAYYDNILNFNEVSSASSELFMVVLKPHLFSGLISVTVIVRIHFTLVIVAIVHFLF